MDIENLLQRCRKRSLSAPVKIVFPEIGNIRMCQAMEVLHHTGVVTPISIAAPSSSPPAKKLPWLEMVPHQDPDDSMAHALMRKKPRITLDDARSRLQERLYFAAALVDAGVADIMVAGIDYPTADVLRASLACVGTRKGIQTASSVMVMGVPHRPLLFFADCGFNVSPDVDALCDIAEATALTAHMLSDNVPRIAFLSFSTHGSAQHAMVDKMTAATAAFRHRRPDLCIDGALQADAAVVPDISRKKIIKNNVLQGNANVLIFPDLNAGNIAYKLLQHLGGAQAVGPLLQGFARPVCDLSRGATADDIVAASLMNVLMIPAQN